MDVWERLFRVIEGGGLEMIAYVYRIASDGTVIKPFLTKMYPDDDMLRMLRDEFRGGEFRLLIREGRKLIYSGDISVVRGNGAE